jgi:hypothetical protein
MTERIRKMERNPLKSKGESGALRVKDEDVADEANRFCGRRAGYGRM